RRYGFAELAARASPTRRHALGILAKYAPLLHASFVASFEEVVTAGGAREGLWTLRTPGAPRGVGRYVQELALAHAVAHVRAGSGAGSGERVLARRAWFAHARPAPPQPRR